MTDPRPARPVDMQAWPRADQFRFFRRYARPHYAVTSRLDVTHLLGRRRRDGVSAYRACLFGIHAVPELLMRFRDDLVVLHETVQLSMTVPAANGSFNYAYVPFVADFADFDRRAEALIAAAAAKGELDANAGARDDVVYLSCLPWIDFTSINNALPGPDDCIPRVSWGKFVARSDGTRDMAMALEVHHALVDGAQVGAFFQAVQRALDAV